jgi:hypothetical protein
MVTIQSRLVGGPKDVSKCNSSDDLADVTKSYAKRRLGLLFSQRLIRNHLDFVCQ